MRFVSTWAHDFVTPKKYALAIRVAVGSYKIMRWNEKIVERMKMLGMRHVSDLARACKPEIHERRAYRIYNGDEPTISELFALCKALKLQLRHFEEDAELPPARVEVDVPAGMSPEDLLAAARLLVEQ